MLDAILLGIVQGLTEFLPISSSGHLVLGEHMLGLFANDRQNVLLEVVLHLGTLLAVVVAYRHDLVCLVSSLLPSGNSNEPERTRCSSHLLIRMLLLGSIPAALVGILFKSQITALFSEPRLVAGLLIVTGLILLAGDRARKGERVAEETGWWRSLLIGMAQALAILPGISRSGSTIVVGLLLGIKPIEAARFSFLLSIPAVGGAALLQVVDLLRGDIQVGIEPAALLAGFAASAIVGYMALQWLLVAVRKRNLSIFALYCLLLGSLFLLLGGAA